jgi:hypothetical protein
MGSKGLTDAVFVSIHPKRVSCYILFRLQIPRFLVFVGVRASICADKVEKILQPRKRKIYCPGGHLWDWKNTDRRLEERTRLSETG